MSTPLDCQLINLLRNYYAINEPAKKFRNRSKKIINYVNGVKWKVIIM